MKEVQDKDGNISEVSDDTMCHAGKNGALPVMLDEDELAVATAELKARAEAWEAGTTKRNAIAKISKLESQITPRRTREAILGTDNGWLTTQESLIAIERNKLKPGE